MYPQKSKSVYAANVCGKTRQQVEKVTFIQNY